jgi:hypothetical protein
MAGKLIVLYFMTSGEFLKLAKRSTAAAWFIPADMCYVECTLALEKTWHDQLGHYWIMHLGSYFLALNSTEKSCFVSAAAFCHDQFCRTPS